MSDLLDAKEDSLMTLLLKISEIGQDCIEILPESYNEGHIEFYRTSAEEVGNGCDIVKEIIRIN